MQGCYVRLRSRKYRLWQHVSTDCTVDATSSNTKAKCQRGSNIGPQICSALKAKLPSIGCQGVGGAYTAALSANLVPVTGTRQAYIAEGQRMLKLAASRCPNTQITAGGYSCVFEHFNMTLN